MAQEGLDGAFGSVDVAHNFDRRETTPFGHLRDQVIDFANANRFAKNHGNPTEQTLHHEQSRHW